MKADRYTRPSNRKNSHRDRRNSGGAAAEWKRNPSRSQVKTRDIIAEAWCGPGSKPTSGYSTAIRPLVGQTKALDHRRLAKAGPTAPPLRATPRAVARTTDAAGTNCRAPAAAH